jgi:hypothetical protein
MAVRRMEQKLELAKFHAPAEPDAPGAELVAEVARYGDSSIVELAQEL